MSDQFKGLVVTFQKPVSEERTKAVKNAIMQMKGVIAVEPVEEELNDYMNRQIVKNQLINDLWKILKLK